MAHMDVFDFVDEEFSRQVRVVRITEWFVIASMIALRGQLQVHFSMLSHDDE